MDKASKKHLRRQYLVDRRYQLGFVTRLLGIIFVAAFVSSLVSMAIMWNSMYDPVMPDQTMLATAASAVAMTLLIEVLLAVPIVFYLGIRSTHRVVGPLPRIKRALEAIGRGDFSQRLTLRSGDVLEDLVESINKMAEQLEQSKSSKR